MAPSVFVKQIKQILAASPADGPKPHMAQKLEIRKQAYISILNEAASPFNMQIP